MSTWVDTPARWRACVEYARHTGILGLDSETYGHDVTETSPAYRAKIHVWSIAFYTGRTTPLGVREARGAVLPPEALEAFRGVLASPSIVKVVHNARHDRHALENHGYRTEGVVDTLDLTRLAYPERSLDPSKGFRLKPLARDLLDKPARDEYDNIIKAMAMMKKTVKVCACGEAKCKRRKAPHDKIDTEVEVEAKVVYALEAIKPGHPHWLRLLDYAAADAVDALEIWDLANRKLASLRRPELPW